jgi:hypothetical protein
MTRDEAHAVLGLNAGAPPEMVRDAYLKAAFWCHPDKNPGNKVAEETFKRVAEAYDVLRKGESRGGDARSRSGRTSESSRAAERAAAERAAAERAAAERAAAERAAAERAAAERAAAERAAAERAVAERAAAERAAAERAAAERAAAERAAAERGAADARRSRSIAVLLTVVLGPALGAVAIATCHSSSDRAPIPSNRFEARLEQASVHNMPVDDRRSLAVPFSHITEAHIRDLAVSSLERKAAKPSPEGDSLTIHDVKVWNDHGVARLVAVVADESPSSAQPDCLLLIAGLDADRGLKRTAATALPAFVCRTARIRGVALRVEGYPFDAMTDLVGLRVSEMHQGYGYASVLLFRLERDSLRQVLDVTRDVEPETPYLRDVVMVTAGDGPNRAVAQMYAAEGALDLGTEYTWNGSVYVEAKATSTKTAAASPSSGGVPSVATGEWSNEDVAAGKAACIERLGDRAKYFTEACSCVIRKTRSLGSRESVLAASQREDPEMLAALGRIDADCLDEDVGGYERMLAAWSAGCVSEERIATFCSCLIGHLRKKYPLPSLMIHNGRDHSSEVFMQQAREWSTACRKNEAEAAGGARARSAPVSSTRDMTSGADASTFTAGAREVLRSASNPKANGLRFKLDYPSLWRSANTGNAEVLFTALEVTDELSVGVSVYVRALPPDLASSRDELFSPKSIGAIVQDRRGTLISTDRTRLAGEPAVWSIVLEDPNRVEGSMKTLTMQLFREESLVTVRFHVAGRRTDAVAVAKKFDDLLSLFWLIANTLVFE